jgi:energy-converting hydrogenase Eha subunit A
LNAGLGDILFWGSLSFSLVVAGVFALPVNRWLIARGKGHAVVHETGVHGGPPVRVVGAVAVVLAIFGTTVLAARAVGGA